MTAAVPSTRSEWAEDRLRQAILRGELRPGQRLHASDLAERWDVSATPLREAFQRLAGAGFVELTPQRSPGTSAPAPPCRSNTCAAPCSWSARWPRETANHGRTTVHDRAHLPPPPGYRITEGAEEIQMRRVAAQMFGYMKQRAPKGV